MLSSELDDQLAMRDHFDKSGAMSPPPPERAKSLIPRSIKLSSSVASRRRSPTEGAIPWIAANCGVALGLVSAERMPTFRTPGAISFSSSNHFVPKPNSAERNPVALPPGRARLCTIPKPTGSVTAANTIGIVRVTFSNSMTLGVGVAKTTSGAKSYQFLRLLPQIIAINAETNINQQVRIRGPA
jgi:hypothetical protein